MTAAVGGRSRRGGWLPWAVAVSLALHGALVVWMYYARGSEPVMRQIERIIPVFVVQPKPAPEPPPEPAPRTEETSGRSGQGLQRPAPPAPAAERPVDPEATLEIPPARSPDPQAAPIVSGAGKGDAPGEGRGTAPGDGTGQGPGRGAGTQAEWSPRWRRLPTPEETGRHYPKAARAAGVEGRVTLKCIVGASGRLYDCVALRESPPGQGFGRAAVGMSQYMRITPRRVNGKPVATEILVPLNITLQGTTVAPPKASE